LKSVEQKTINYGYKILRQVAPNFLNKRLKKAAEGRRQIEHGERTFFYPNSFGLDARVIRGGDLKFWN
jgi:hypothetical protein